MSLPSLRAAAVLVTVALSARAAAAQPVLTDVTLFGSSVAGQYVGGPAWNTRPGDALPTVFLSPDANAAFVAGNVYNPGAALSLPLAVGSTTIHYYANGGFSPFFGLNLFFDGASTPGISAFNSFGTGPAPSAAPCTLAPAGACIPGAGAFSFTSGGYTVTLASYVLLADAAENGGSVDRVGDVAVGADGTFDDHARLVLDVSPTPLVTPEPSTLALAAAGLAALGAGARRLTRVTGP